MPRQSSRRAEICEAALELAAAGGNHALTHQAIDKQLGIAQGSTSYYFRTRQVLVLAAINHLTSLTRETFVSARGSGPAAPPTVPGAAKFIARQVDHLLGPRRRDVLARYALLPDAVHDDELRVALARCLFSLEAAEALMLSLGATDPSRAAGDLLSLLEGLLFDRTYGARAGVPAGTRAGVEGLRRPIERWLTALVSE